MKKLLYPVKGMSSNNDSEKDVFRACAEHSWQEHGPSGRDGEEGRYAKHGINSVEELEAHIKASVQDEKTKGFVASNQREVYMSPPNADGYSTEVILNYQRDENGNIIGGTCVLTDRPESEFKRLHKKEIDNNGKTPEIKLQNAYEEIRNEAQPEHKSEEIQEKQHPSEKPPFQPNDLSGPPTSAQERHQWATEGLSRNDPQAMRDALTIEAKQFDTEQAILHDAAAHTKDASEKKRLELRAAIEQAEHQAVTKKVEAKLHGQEQGFDSKDSLQASRKAKDAEKRYEADKQEWHKRSVRDDAYKPFDAELAKKAQVVRDQESASWAKLAARSKREGWDQQREQTQREALQNKLDAQLDQSFSMQHGYGHDR